MTEGRLRGEDTEVFPSSEADGHGLDLQLEANGGLVLWDASLPPSQRQFVGLAPGRFRMLVAIHNCPHSSLPLGAGQWFTRS